MTPDQFKTRCVLLASQKIPEAQRDGVNHAALTAGHAVDVGIGVVTGGKFYLRGTKSRKPLRALVKKTRSTSDPTATVTATSPGIMWWIEHGVHPHLVGSGSGKTGTDTTKKGRLFSTGTSKSGKATRSFKRKLLTLPDGRVVTGPFVAGGSPARHTFSLAVNSVNIAAEVQKDIRKAVFGTLR